MICRYAVTKHKSIWSLFVNFWLFGLLQIFIAVFGLAAYFYVHSLLLTGIAAVSATILGMSHPLLSARKQKTLKESRDKQCIQTLSVVPGGVNEQLEGPIAPPPPHRATVAVFLELAGLGNSRELLRQYDDLVTDICEADKDCVVQAAVFSAELTGNVLGVAMEGLAALALGDLGKARHFFEEATQLNSSWAMPWLGWAATCFQQGDYETLALQHPHINGVELLNYDCGDEEVFLQLSQSDRENLLDLCQQTTTALGNYYAAAEFARSRQTRPQTKDELHPAA